MTNTKEPASGPPTKRARKTPSKTEPAAKLDQIVDLSSAMAQHEEKVAARRSTTRTPRRATAPAQAAVPPAPPESPVEAADAAPTSAAKSRSRAKTSASGPAASVETGAAGTAGAASRSRRKAAPKPEADASVTPEPAAPTRTRKARAAAEPTTAPPAVPDVALGEGGSSAKPAKAASSTKSASTRTRKATAAAPAAEQPAQDVPPAASEAPPITLFSAGEAEPPAPAPRTRKRVSRAAGAPTAAAEAAGAGADAAPIAGADGAGAGDVGAAAVEQPTRRTRVRARTTASGVGAEPTSEPAGQDAAPAADSAASTTATSTDETSKATTRTRTRTRKTAEVTEPAPAEPAASSAGEDAGQKAGRGTTRTRTRRAGSATEPPAAAPATAPPEETTAGVGVPVFAGPSGAGEPFAAPGAGEQAALPPTQRPAPPVDADGAPRLPMTALLFQAPEVAAQQAHRGAAELAAEALEEEMVRAEAKKVRGAAKKKGSKAATQASGKKDTAQASGATPPATSPAEEQPSEPTATESQDDAQGKPRRRGGRGKGGKGAKSRADEAPQEQEVTASSVVEDDDESSGSRRRRRRRRSERGAEAPADEVTGLTGSTRLEAKRQRRREGRDAGRRRPVITESEFLARREAVDRLMVVRELDGRTQIAVLEDGILVEHYLSRHSQSTIVGDVYLGRVHNVLPSMEAAFVDIGKTRNAVLYAGEVNWDAAGMSGQPRRIEDALKAGDSVLVQVTKDPIGHKGARLTSQITLAGRHMVLVPSGGMTGISRKLPDHERTRLKKQLKKIVPDGAGVIVRTAAEGASEAELTADMARLTERWAQIQNKTAKAHAPALLKGEPDIAIRVIRDVFNEDFASLVVQGQSVWHQISSYIGEVAPDLAQRMELWTGTADVFAQYRIDEQLMKALDRKVWLPSGGSLIIDRTEAMTVIDVNTGKFTGSGGTLEETVTRNNLEAAEEIVRQLRLRDIGGIIVIDFIDMVLESNRDLVLRRLIECLGRDRTRHQVAEVTSLGLVQMTRKRVGQGLVEAFSEVCENCHGRGYLVTADAEGVPEPKRSGGAASSASTPAAQPERKAKRTRGGKKKAKEPAPVPIVGAPPEVKATLASIAAAATHRHQAPDEGDLPLQDSPSDGATPGQAAEPPDGGSGEQDKTEPPAQPAKKASKTAKPAKASKTAKAAPKSKSAPPAEQATPAPAAAPAADPAAEAPRPKRTRRKATAPAGPPPSL